MKQLFIILAAATLLIISSITPAWSDQTAAALLPPGGHIEQRQNETIIYDRNWNRRFTLQSLPDQNRTVIYDHNWKPIGELNHSPAVTKDKTK